jgi:hypothetical protein
MRFKLLVLALLSVAPLAAQAPQQQVADFKQMLAMNQAKRRMFTWLETTHVAYQGVIKVTKVTDCQYVGPSPKPACTEISLQQAPPPSGFFRRKIAESKEADMKAYMDTVRTLIAEYVPISPALIQKAYEGGNVSIAMDPSNGTKKLVISNYRMPNDNLTVIFNAATKQLVSASISTYTGTAASPVPVTATVTFATLPNGVFYAYQKTLNATGASITVTITSTDFSEMIQQ